METPFPAPPHPQTSQPASFPLPPAYAPLPPPIYAAPYGYRPGPAPGVEYAGFWIRFWAWFVDALIIGVPSAIITAALNLNQYQETVRCSGAGLCVASDNGPLLGGNSWVDILVMGVYFVLMWSLHGSTLGQRLFHLAVVDAATGQRIGLGRAIGRYIGFLISAWLFCIGLVWAGIDARKQGWHDKIASTYVIRRR